ncbi:hypothetical protein MMC2321_04531 [Chitinophaga sp. MM2321]
MNFRCIIWAVFLISIVYNPIVGFGQQHQIVRLGDKREIFVDHYLIDKLTDVKMVMHTPRNEGAVLKFDSPWEGPFSGYTTIIKDGDILRAYYRGLPVPGDGSPMEVTCYAESKDGVHWIKPDLGIYNVRGSLKNNVILADAAPVTHNFCPFLDANPAAPKDQRYKALGGYHPGGLLPYVSADGIHWKKLQDSAVLKAKSFAFDSQNVPFWSESEQKYVCYFRTWTKDKFRSVSRSTSQDFINWTTPVPMEFGDTPPEHLYTHQTSPYYRAPHIYVAIGARFMPDRQVVADKEAIKLNVNPSYYKDCSDAVLLSTRGGNEYSRTFMESFIRPGIGLENWVSRSNYPALNVVQTSPVEMSVYVNENYAQHSAHLKRFSLRIDGFSSLSAPYNGGEMLTKPFVFSGKELEINYSTSAAGEIRIEIQDEKGKAIPGYTLKDAQIIIGNEIKRIVSWNGNESVSKIAGKPVRLRIYMKDADLYSIKFN